jgi:hypothetical protein
MRNEQSKVESAGDAAVDLDSTLELISRARAGDQQAVEVDWARVESHADEFDRCTRPALSR